MVVCIRYSKLALIKFAYGDVRLLPTDALSREMAEADAINDEDDGPTKEDYFGALMMASSENP